MTLVLLGDDAVCACLAESLGAEMVSESAVNTVPEGSAVLVPFAFWRTREAALEHLMRRAPGVKWALLSADGAAQAVAERRSIPCLPLSAARRRRTNHRRILPGTHDSRRR